MLKLYCVVLTIKESIENFPIKRLTCFTCVTYQTEIINGSLTYLKKKQNKFL